MPKLQSHISLQQKQRECANNFALKCLSKRYIPSSAKSLALQVQTFEAVTSKCIEGSRFVWVLPTGVGERVQVCKHILVTTLLGSSVETAEYNGKKCVACLGSSAGLQLPFKTHGKLVDHNRSRHAICERYRLFPTAPEGEAGKPSTLQRLSNEESCGECKGRACVWWGGQAVLFSSESFGDTAQQPSGQHCSCGVCVEREKRSGVIV